jgi:hypothetical protein
VKLYQGPGTAYDVVRNLPHGSILNVVRRLIGNPDWIQVAVVDPNEITGGWVYTANGSVQLNVNLSEISQIREFGPKLYEPARYAQYAIDDLITFKWEDLGPLEENQHYSLILVRNDLPDEQACYHWQPPGPEETFRPEDYGCTPGAYHWGVGLATDLAEGKGDPIWRDDSFRDERNPIGIGMPYPDTPTDTSYPEGTGSLPPPP